MYSDFTLLSIRGEALASKYIDGLFFLFSEKCTAGYASMSGFVPCYPCPIGTYQPDDGKSACIKCPQGADTMTSASTNSSYCESKINILSSTCSIFIIMPFFLLMTFK